MDRIREKLEKLVRLADRPGCASEGEAARLAALRLCLKYGIKCKFTSETFVPSGRRPTASTPPSNGPRKTAQESYDAIFYEWIESLRDCGWWIYETTTNKVGLQLSFRKAGFNSELRVMQRKNSDDFEAEHIMDPDPDQDGRDWSFSTYMTTSLSELLRHIDYTHT